MRGNKLEPDDLKIGMRVKTEQLENIFGIWVYFDHYDYMDGGKIIYFTSDENDVDAAKAVRKNNGLLSIFYQSPDYESGEVDFYE